MGFERPGRKLSLDEIIARLDNGETVRGEKGFETVLIRGSNLKFNRSTGELYLTENGATIHARINKNREVEGIQLTESESGNPYRDREKERAVRQFLESVAPELLT